MPKQAGADYRGAFLLLSIAAPLAWAGLVYTILNVSPDGTAGRFLFFVLFYIALMGTFSLAAYFLSFRLFATRLYQGNAARSLQQGALLATFVLAAALLRVTRALSLFSLIIMLAVLLVAEIVVLSRKTVR